MALMLFHARAHAVAPSTPRVLSFYWQTKIDPNGTAS